MEDWKQVWYDAIAPQIDVVGLEALEVALENDDERLMQGCTTVPPALEHVTDWPVEACCPISFCGWRSQGLRTVGEVELYFATVCYVGDTILGNTNGMRCFLNWWDSTERSVAIPQLLAEVRQVLVNRYAQMAIA